MRIAYINSIFGKDDFRGGGLATHLLTIPIVLSQLGHPVTIITTKGVKNKHKRTLDIIELSEVPILQSEKELIVPIYFFKRVRYLLKVAWYLYKNRDNFDIVEFADAGLEQVFCFFLPHPPIVTRLHSATSEIREYKLNPLIRLLELYVAKKSGFLVAPSKSYAKLCKARYKRNDIQVIPYALPPGFEKLKPMSGKSNFSKIILFVGMLSHRKGFDILLKVAGELPSAKFICVGGNLENINTNQLPKNVLYLGTVTQTALKRLLSDADIIFAPTRFETFGISILEAMSQSKTIVASRTTGVIDLIEDKKTGVLFKVGDSKDAARILERLVKNRPQAKYLSANAYEVSKEYLPEKIAQLTIDTYLKFLNYK